MEEVKLSEDEKKAKYKSLMRWRLSDNCKEIIEESTENAEELLEVIKKEFTKRKKVELTLSEVNKLDGYCKFLTLIIGKIDDSEGGVAMKEIIGEQVARAYTHIYNKVGVGFDVPVFTKMDGLKDERNCHVTIAQRFDEIINEFSNEKDVKDSLNPYEGH
jgi:hypothetical protein